MDKTKQRVTVDKDANAMLAEADGFVEEENEDPVLPEEETEETSSAKDHKKQKPKKQYQPNTKGFPLSKMIHFRDEESAKMFKKANINRFKENNKKQESKSDKEPVEKAAN